MNVPLPTELGLTEAERAAWGLVPPAHIELHTHPESGQLLFVICACGLGRDHRFGEAANEPAEGRVADPWL
ncbi:MAG TPA: hypothetical protein VGC45_01255 [Gryllotalpicola sp.]